jgi:hypothetical protein
MKFIIPLLAFAALAWLFLPMLKASFIFAPRPLSLVINTATSLPDGEHVLHLLPTAAHAANVLVKRGSAGYYAVCGANDQPIGIVTEQVTANDITLGRKQAVYVLGLYKAPLLVTASEALPTPSTHVYTAANGQVQDEPATAGTYWCVGATNDPIGNGLPGAISHWQPLKLVVLAAPTSTNGTAGSAADLAALKAEAEKIGDDVRALYSAFAGGRTLVKCLA